MCRYTDTEFERSVCVWACRSLVVAMRTYCAVWVNDWACLCVPLRATQCVHSATEIRAFENLIRTPRCCEHLILNFYSFKYVFDVEFSRIMPLARLYCLSLFSSAFLSIHVARHSFRFVLVELPCTHTLQINAFNMWVLTEFFRLGREREWEQKSRKLYWNVSLKFRHTLK